MTSLGSFLNRFNLIRQIPVFTKLNWFDIQRIVNKATVSEYRKGDIISKEGNPPDFFYCLVSGRLQAYTANEQGIKCQVDYIHRGKYFGVISTFTGENHSMTFEALNDSVVLKIPHDEFRDILKKIPHLGVVFSKSLSRRMRRKVRESDSAFESNIISIYSPIKGTGSSTYAVNMALSLQRETRKKVILVSIARKCKENSEDGEDSVDGPMIDATGSHTDMQEILENYDEVRNKIIKDDLEVDILNVIFDPLDEMLKDKISPLVSSLVGEYHYVVVDLPNDTDDVVFETLTQSDQIHLISFDRREDLGLIKGVIDRLKISLQSNFKKENVKLILRTSRAQMYLSFEEHNQYVGHDVCTMLPGIEDADIATEVEYRSMTFLKCKDESAYAKAIRSIAREVGGVLVGLALGGAAALGLAHIGVLKVLEEENIPIDVVSGSSMGALIASLWATGRNYQELKEIADEFKEKSSLIKLIDPTFPISGLIRGRRIKKWIKKYLGGRTFYSTRIPLKVVAYDLNRRQDIVHNSGKIVDAVRESISIPGVLTPLKRDDKLVIDGGVMNPLPSDVLAGMGVQKIISVNVLQSPSDVTRGYEARKAKLEVEEKKAFMDSPVRYVWFRICRFVTKIFSPSITEIIVLTLQAAEYVIAEQSAQQADVAIHPDVSEIEWYELYRVDELVKRGEAAARQHLPQIKRMIGEIAHET